MDYADIRNKMFDSAEQFWWGSIGISVSLLILSVLSILLNFPSSIVALSGLYILITPILRLFLRRTSRSFSEKGDVCRRTIMYADGLGISIPEFQAKLIRSWVVQTELNKAPFNPPYFDSKKKAGPVRLMDNLAESTYFTNFLASKVESILSVALLLIVLITVSSIYLATSFNFTQSQLFQLNKLILVVATFLLSEDVFEHYLAFRRLANESGVIYREASTLASKKNLKPEEALQKCEEYTTLLASSPPLPFLLYRYFRDALDKAYKGK